MTANAHPVPPRRLLGPVLANEPAGSDLPLVRLVTEDAPTADALAPAAALHGFTAARGRVWAAPDPHGGVVLHVGLGLVGRVDAEVLCRALTAAGPRLLALQRFRLELPHALDGQVGADGGWALGRALAVALHRALPLSGDAAAIDEVLALLPLAGGGGGESGPAVHLVGGVPDGELAEGFTAKGFTSEGFAAGVRAGAAQAFASVLVDLPANVLTPAALARVAQAAAAAAGGHATVITGQELVDLGAGGLLAVGAGAVNPPHLVHVRVGPQDRRPDLTIVGKGITFDSGGLSIKDAEWMSTMKYDMAGAAAALATVCAAAGARPDLRVDAVLALAENMPSATATRPGDVVRSLDGTTIEVLNTDFEGRVVLADALAFAARLTPRYLVDLATLTESVMFALGTQVYGLFTAHDGLAGLLAAGSVRGGEPLWRMPLDDRYDEQLSSDLADVRNYPEHHRFARSITAARFLARFVPAGIPWAHLDIAGPAWDGDGPGRRGGTGVPVGTLLALLRELDAAAEA